MSELKTSWHICLLPVEECLYYRSVQIMGETAPKTVVDTQQGHYIGHYIVELKDLALITDDDFIESFKGSISTIFKYNRKDIQQTIEPRDINKFA